MLEGLLGYDFAVEPAKQAIWTILETARPPGLVLEPSLWATLERPDSDRLPSRVISLIIQTKRPVLLDHWRAKQHHYWRRAYFRFNLEPDQQQILSVLERNARGQAVVRYASPAFVLWADLEHHQEVSTIAEHSSFVAPLNLVGHDVWTYAGAGTVGWANPEGEEVQADMFEGLMSIVVESASRQTIAEHLFKLAAAVAGLPRDLRFEVSRVRRPRPEERAIDLASVPEESLELVRAWVTVARVVAWAGASWMLLCVD